MISEEGSTIQTEKARFYQHKLDLLLTGSKLAQSYLHNEVFLIERFEFPIFSKLFKTNNFSYIFSEGNSSLKVHFNIHVDPAKGDSNSNDIVEVITNEINASNTTEDHKSILENLIVDIDSINIHGKLKFEIVSRDCFWNTYMYAFQNGRLCWNPQLITRLQALYLVTPQHLRHPIQNPERDNVDLFR